MSMSWKNEKLKHEIKMELLRKPKDEQPRKIYNKNEKYLIINGWLDMQEVVPDKNQSVEIKAEFWRNKELVDEEIIQTIYCGWNNVINHPIFEHETFDMQFMKVRFWKPVGE